MSMHTKREAWVNFFAILGLFFIIMVLWSYLTGFVLKLSLPFYVNGFVQGLVLLSLSLLFRGSNESLIADYKLKVDKKLKVLVQGITVGFLLAILMGVSSWVLERLNLPIEDQAVASELAKVHGFSEFLPLVILVGLVVPITEEVFFRGFCYRLFAESFGNRKGIVLSGVFFGLMHFDLYRALPLALAGIFLAWSYSRFNSLWVPILAHSTWNTIMALLIFGNVL